MKCWLIFLLMLFSFTANAQVKWPHNQQTGKVEFEGTIPWPANDTTAVQRQELVSKWYQVKLTDVQLIQLTKWYSDLPPTAYNLPAAVMLKYHRIDYYKQEHVFQLEYKVQLEPTVQGLKYHLSEFVCGWSDEDVAQEAPLERMPNAPASELAMTRFRKRIESALTGWY